MLTRTKRSYDLSQDLRVEANAYPVVYSRLFKSEPLPESLEELTSITYVKSEYTSRNNSGLDNAK